MLDFTKLWDPQYLFSSNYFELSRSDYIFLGIAGLSLVLGIAYKFFSLRREKASPGRFIMNRWFHLYVTTGLLLLLWFGFRYEGIPWLGTHVAALGILAIAAVWKFFVWKYFFRDYQVQKKLWEEDRVKRKYLQK